jgi:beta-xylosidase
MMASNPVIWADFPDPDVIRVGETYYMASTTMHMFPGGQILKSYDLVHWEHACYVFDTLGDSLKRRLDGGHIYGKGMWAATFRYHNGLFHLMFTSNDAHKSYHYTARDVQGPWVRHEIRGLYYDCSLLFDEDGRVFIAHGNREIRITELDVDLGGPKDGGLDRIALTDTGNVRLGFEGTHFHKINGRYYLFCIHWPNDGFGRRTEVCYAANSLTGEFTGGTIVDDDLGFHNMGVAQGGVIDTPGGQWYLMLFQDHGAVGRIPVLAPMVWKNGFPEVCKIPVSLPLDKM